MDFGDLGFPQGHGKVELEFEPPGSLHQSAFPTLLEAFSNQTEAGSEGGLRPDPPARRWYLQARPMSGRETSRGLKPAAARLPSDRERPVGPKPS